MNSVTLIIVALIIAAAIVGGVYIYSKSQAQSDLFSGLIKDVTDVIAA